MGDLGLNSFESELKQSIESRNNRNSVKQLVSSIDEEESKSKSNAASARLSFLNSCASAKPDISVTPSVNKIKPSSHVDEHLTKLISGGLSLSSSSPPISILNEELKVKSEAATA